MIDLPKDLDDRDLLAAELVLGLIEGDDLAETLRLRLSDRAFAQTVEKWEAHLAPLFDHVPEQQAPDRILQAIEARLDVRRDGSDQSDATDEVVDHSLIDRLKRWRAAAIVGGTVAASLALALLVRPSPVVVTESRPQQQVVAPQLIAQLTGEQEGLSVATRYDEDSGQLHVIIQGIEPGNGAPVLWVVPADGTPRALGVLPTDRDGSLQIDPNYSGFIDAGSVLAITIEDPDGAPYKAPTTPIIASGTLSKI
ncbi:anti-sigma factor [Parasphingorhabdus halotolerans]|uniref:Anti-sigma K factor RskA C-terminal domain-containing protein n=1 Tax=Parasphingorhabdus halotolerans TaxID=2725558 RepID=A0A6H2DQR8_9SPHN|nr:anti-sigma factor [Parasphingorhabdus halotolerans]QJB70548.1 hypothetical protein HF685_15855 [Parasphingorhabdus halotolerans]